LVTWAAAIQNSGREDLSLVANTMNRRFCQIYVQIKMDNSTVC